MSLIDPSRIGFRPVNVGDYPLLLDWMSRPHWREWWGEPETELGYVRDMVEGRDTTRPFIFMLDGAAAGYIQHWTIADQLFEPWLSQAPLMKELPEDSIGVDLSIADNANLSKGLGTAVLKAFLKRLIDDGHRTVIIDPDASNARAIRAYEKAGFRPLKFWPDPDGDGMEGILLMQLDMTNLTTTGVSP